MRLLVVSHTPHYVREDRYVGWAPTVREISQLATLFTEVRHIACLYEGPAPASSLGYEATNVELVPVPPAGGDGAFGKLDALWHVPTYALAIRRELERADFVHVRAPANIAMVALAQLRLRRHPPKTWIKYAGNWRPTSDDSASYRLQRAWLRRDSRIGVVTVNGEWPDDPPWVHAFLNPSLSNEDLEHGRAAAARKTHVLPLQLVFVSSLLPNKGGARVVEIVRRLVERGLDVTLEIIGDGPDRAALEASAHAHELDRRITFRGWLSPAQVRDAFGRAHVQVLPSANEGWPKVLSEGMAYGVVPVASAVSAIPQLLARFETGAALGPDDIDAFVHALSGYCREPERWHAESARAIGAASQFSYDNYLARVRELLDLA